MNSNPLMDPAIRDHLLADPESLLGDTDIMRVLVDAKDAARGRNVIDLRSVAMDRLRDRLDRLEEMHRTVIAAAHDNLAGTGMIHRAVLHLMEPRDLPGLVDALGGSVADALRVDAIRLLVERAAEAPVAGLDARTGPVSIVAPRACARHVGATGAPRRVTLRRLGAGEPGPATTRSEASLSLDFGRGVLPGMLILGARDPDQFAPGQGTDLLAFLAGAVERAFARHLC